MSIYIGTSGWSYDHWQGVLYPHDIPLRNRLDFYTGNFGTVELNSSYYHWPKDATFASWQRRTPGGFQMTVKAPRGLTHSKRLYDPDAWLARIARGMEALGEKRAVLLVQLPPGFECDMARLRYFLEQKPPWLRMAVEFRHPSWHNEAVFGLLEAHNTAYCIMSGARLPCILRATASVVYVRLHGPDTDFLYGGSYSQNDLEWWAQRLREWQSQGREVFAYFHCRDQVARSQRQLLRAAPRLRRGRAARIDLWFAASQSRRKTALVFRGQRRIARADGAPATDLRHFADVQIRSRNDAARDERRSDTNRRKRAFFAHRQSRGIGAEDKGSGTQVTLARPISAPNSLTAP